MKSPQRTKQEARNDKEYTPEHQNPYLFNRLVRCPSQDKSLAKFRQLKDCVPFIEHNARHSTRTTPLIANAYTTKISHYRVMISSWTAIRLCVLLVLLHWTSIVSGSNMEIYQPGLPSSGEILKSLKNAGFRWQFYDTKPRVVFCSSEETPESTPTPDATDNTNPNPTQPNSTPNSALRYAVHFSSMHLCYTLPSYPNASAMVLDTLKRITVIKVKKVKITYARVQLKHLKERLVLLCRLLNLFECKSLELVVNSYKSMDKYKGGFDLDRERKEAEDTIKWAGSAPFHLIINSNIPPDAHLKHIFSGLVILRPVSDISLPSKYAPNISGYLESLSLTEDPSLTICYFEGNIQIDLKAIKRAAHKCSIIIFDIREVSDPVITGLEEEVSANDIAITLAAEWSSIQHIVMHNKSSVNVHALLYNPCGSELLKSLIQIVKVNEVPESRITSNKAILLIPKCDSCDSPAYYKNVLTLNTFAKCGITVKDIEFEYENDRNDLFTHLKELCEINALSRIPAVFAAKNIVCLGHALSDPCWEIEEPVNIRLIKFGPWPACQNIRYTTLSISGDKNPNLNYVENCHTILNKLRSINAQNLRISNVRDCPPTDTNFDMAKLKYRLANLLRFDLNVETLILDNVDDCILYRMLGCYDFTCSKLTEIHLLNHRFTSLAIAQILTLPMAKKISKLVINRITRLNEIKHFHQRKELIEFSLFNYLEKRNGKKEAEEIDLHKLVLRPEPTIFDSYKTPLQALRDRGVQVLTSSDKYSTDPPFPTQPHMVDMKEFTYYTTTFDALKADLAMYQSTSLTQPNPTLTPIPNPVHPDSITTMFLRISDAHSLTRTDLNTIIRWIGCRFKSLTSLWLANCKLVEEDRKILASCTCIARGLRCLWSIQIEDATPGKDPLELPLHPYYNKLLAITSDPMPTPTAVSYKVLSQLYTHCDKIEEHILTYKDINASLRAIIDVLRKEKAAGRVFKCPYCHRSLCMPSEEKNDNEPDTKKSKVCFDPSTNFEAVCYLNCKQLLCIHCVNLTSNSHIDRCLICKGSNTNPYIFMRLTSVPSPLFIFPNSSANDYTIDFVYPQTLSSKDSCYYFYLPYKSIESLDIDLYKEHLSCIFS
ncbi:hypothetical protein NEHOM01_0991 [Nematocida homosporus]|uniref:uncharacterized protein n=1 Tax=Nematocida homosporus TaxID=1912981 RepID=UPI00221FBCDA|nr:uncharacterized protein NEHOM01_0991 [Nematocida homosporus]KAI5185699.1 hypothetical protein NEHOM01_0991 [Nematocida homosporus]